MNRLPALVLEVSHSQLAGIKNPSGVRFWTAYLAVCEKLSDEIE